MQKNILLLATIACGSIYAMEEVDWTDVPKLKKQCEEALQGTDRERAVIAYQQFTCRTKIDNDQLTFDQFLAMASIRMGARRKLSERFGEGAASQSNEHVIASLKKSIEEDTINNDFEWAQEFGENTGTPPSPKTLKNHRLVKTQELLR